MQDPILLSREEAANANIPPAGTKSTLEAYPLPVRALLPEEKAIVDPFGRIFIQAGDEDGLTVMEVLMRLAKEIGEVKEMVKQLL